jgi:hypothetical protein
MEFMIGQVAILIFSRNYLNNSEQNYAVKYIRRRALQTNLFNPQNT